MIWCHLEHHKQYSQPVLILYGRVLLFVFHPNNIGQAFNTTWCGLSVQLISGDNGVFGRFVQGETLKTFKES